MTHTVGAQLATNNAWDFYPEFESVSQFTCAQAAWQAVQGGLPYVLRAWLVGGGVAVDAGDGYVVLATREATQFQSASALLGIGIRDWYYATLKDSHT